MVSRRKLLGVTAAGSPIVGGAEYATTSFTAHDVDKLPEGYVAVDQTAHLPGHWRDDRAKLKELLEYVARNNIVVGLATKFGFDYLSFDDVLQRTGVKPRDHGLIVVGESENIGGITRSAEVQYALTDIDFVFLPEPFSYNDVIASSSEKVDKTHTIDDTVDRVRAQGGLVSLPPQGVYKNRITLLPDLRDQDVATYVAEHRVNVGWIEFDDRILFYRVDPYLSLFPSDIEQYIRKQYDLSHQAHMVSVVSGELPIGVQEWVKYHSEQYADTHGLAKTAASDARNVESLARCAKIVHRGALRSLSDLQGAMLEPSTIQVGYRSAVERVVSNPRMVAGFFG